MILSWKVTFVHLGYVGDKDLLKITCVVVGKIKEKYFTDAVKEYAKRLRRYCKLEIVELPDEKTPDGASTAEEAAMLM